MNLRVGRVTPGQIRAAMEAAISRGVDRERLEREHAALVKVCGGEAEVAVAWTAVNLMRAFDVETNGPSAVAQLPDDRVWPRELIRLHPDLAALLDP